MSLWASAPPYNNHMLPGRPKISPEIHWKPPDGYRFGRPSRARHYREHRDSRWMERVFLVTAEGFSKQEEIDADVRYWRIPKKVHIKSVLETAGVVGSVAEEFILFIRSGEFTPDGMAIFQEERT